MSEDSDTPLFAYDAKYYVEDRKEWIPPVDDVEILREKNEKLSKQLRNGKLKNEKLRMELRSEKLKNEKLRKQLEEARALAPVLINE